MGPKHGPVPNIPITFPNIPAICVVVVCCCSLGRDVCFCLVFASIAFSPASPSSEDSTPNEILPGTVGARPVYLLGNCLVVNVSCGLLGEVDECERRHAVVGVLWQFLL